MELKVSSLAERPEMYRQVVEMPDTWPEFMQHDFTGNAHYDRIATELPEYVLFAADGRGELPARGWDQVLVWAFQDLRSGTRPDTVSAISIVVSPHTQGTGLSGRMLAAMRDNAAAHGFLDVVAPVRPSAKHLEPRTPIAEYAYRVRADGLPHDPWLRVHARAGATIVATAPASMCIAASLEEWRAWTGLPFDKEGEVEVPGALAPVRCDLERGFGVYVEPNVWMRHQL